jgi:hypothetical protein
MRHKMWLSAVGIAAVSVLTAGPAFAHECIIVNRSAIGDQQATNSGRWEISTVSDFLVGEFGFTPECASVAVADAAAAGLPTQFTVRADKTIAEGSADPNLGDNKGLDHLGESPIAGAILGIAFAEPCAPQP